MQFSPFFKEKSRRYTKSVLMRFMSNLIANLIIKRSSFISVNP
jgi:hypothetical protein